MFLRRRRALFQMSYFQVRRLDIVLHQIRLFDGQAFQKYLIKNSKRLECYAIVNKFRFYVMIYFVIIDM